MAYIHSFAQPDGKCKNETQYVGSTSTDVGHALINRARCERAQAVFFSNIASGLMPTCLNRPR
jgi:hypothetical protein